MILKEASMQIKYLKDQGVSTAQIARQLGICRQTVYNQLKRHDAPASPPRDRTSKLETFKAYIGHRLERFDLPATVLFEELQAQGYRGKLTILREFIRPFPPRTHRRRWASRVRQSAPSQGACRYWSLVPWGS